MKLIKLDTVQGYVETVNPAHVVKLSELSLWDKNVALGTRVHLPDGLTVDSAKTQDELAALLKPAPPAPDLVKAARAMLDAYGGDIPRWLREPATALAQALEAVT